ncbi:MAG TPA: hypothetical protein VF166_14250 [Gemmatimonadaceae bacterium]
MLAAAVLAASTSARAQQIGLPVLQNAFVNAGTTLGADYGAGSNAVGAGIAAAWVPGSTAFQLSGGLGVYAPDQGGRSGAWGLRIMAPAPKLRGRGLGLAAFLGVGGTSVNGVTEFRVPAGVSIGYRRALGTTHSVSGYAAPFYSWSRVSTGGVSSTHGQFRVSFGIDAVIIPGLGATIGYETGTTARLGEPGPTGGIVGVGVSYALFGGR